jgi:hypothetical protein
VVEPFGEVFASVFGEVLLAGGYFGGVLFGLGVGLGCVWEVALFVEGVGTVVAELIIVHDETLKLLGRINITIEFVQKK